ncbi:TIGR01777 family oxidoreductase [Undibacterium sp. SXout7W]|uniref:TIGR01777 family oxidoreductase n=1 Tax=Undibacterium sp. SXout7W TaxID=3413049 RepID=UPI003BF45682
MRILMTGGTGLIGRRLCAALSKAGHQITVFSRHPESVKRLCGETINAIGSLDDYHADSVWDAIINLAGEPIVDQRWSARRKQVLRDSRIALTDSLMEKVRAAKHPPSIFLSGSAIGVYGDTGDTEEIMLDESAPAGKDFGAQLCVDWEASAMQAAGMDMRVCILRTGLVLDSAGGVLKKMRLPFSLGLGSRIGHGRQWMSWIHISDYVALVCRLLEDEQARGVFNMVAPHPVRNIEFTRELASALHRPALLVAPAFVLQLALGEMSVLLTGGQRVLPSKAQALSYTFQYPELNVALRNLLG